MYTSTNDKNMKIKSKIILSIIIFFFSACTNYNVNKQILLEEKKFYSSSGFALIYDNDLYEQKIRRLLFSSLPKVKLTDLAKEFKIDKNLTPYDTAIKLSLLPL